MSFLFFFFIYNNLVNLTRNKDLYKNFDKQDEFSDRLLFFLFHFAFFLKTFKKNNKKEILQEIYDYIFRQLELSIREIGYGDQTINKKMKNYLNLFYGIIVKINDWEQLDDSQRYAIISSFINHKADNNHLVEYFSLYFSDLSNNTLNSYIKGVDNRKN